ncbi:unnamed protein product [Zymoseptoria tritici ST99CH_3D1]|uniref:Kynurenine formamidase n=1 Tax=Zymoseptoria tritici ST99CH_1E4 TaxID=1276532 RepID=A0A2H1FNB7_ZYMTR|nr:unnamed protein product [Zymoseptoria tritici ST99CH_1E4]SMR44991.1 unnamed protein product [Zymoseptoria tritici ST99CH_3D1]
MPDEWPQFRTNTRYSEQSNLNTLQTCIPRPTSSNDHSRLWIVYIHGGAWSDPLQSASTFDTAQSLLLASPTVSHIAGFASINYRLSPAPSHRTDPSNPADPARNARHPDHVNDVLKAILHLQETYRFAERYVLVGHSCGACLALQVAMKRYWGQQYAPTAGLEMNVVPPVAVLGIEGLYDLPALVKFHAAQPFYRGFVERAFGEGERAWAAASPAHADLRKSWEEGKLVVIAHSREDELVEWEQPELMLRSLEEQGFRGTGSPRVRLLELRGKHDQVWEEGREVARAIEFTVEELLGIITSTRTSVARDKALTENPPAFQDKSARIRCERRPLLTTHKSIQAFFPGEKVAMDVVQPHGATAEKIFTIRRPSWFVEEKRWVYTLDLDGVEYRRDTQFAEEDLEKVPQDTVSSNGYPRHGNECC